MQGNILLKKNEQGYIDRKKNENQHVAITQTYSLHEIFTYNFGSLSCSDLRTPRQPYNFFWRHITQKGTPKTQP